MPPFPAAPPTVDGTRVTVDELLRQPLRILEDLQDLTLQRFFAEELFTPGEDVPAGAVVYDQLSSNDIFPDRDVQRVTPGSELPLIVTSRREPRTAFAKEVGGKFFATYKAITRNAIGDFTRDERLLANAMVRWWNAEALAVLNASIAAVGASAVVTGTDWSDPNADIYGQLASVQFAAEQREMGLELDTVIVNSAQGLDIDMSEKLAKRIRELPPDVPVLRGAGQVQVQDFTVIRSNRQPAGTALVLQRGVQGNRHIEPAGGGDDIEIDANGLAVQRWDEKSERRWYVQGWKSEVLYVNNPFAVYRLQGI